MRHSALSQHHRADRCSVFSQAFPECHLISLSTYTSPPPTHTNTQPPSSSTGPRQLPGLTVPEQRVLAGKISPPCLSLPHPVLPLPASSAGLSGSSCLQNNIHCQWEVGDIEGLLALVSRTLHIQPAAQLCRQIHRLKKNPLALG